MQKRELIIGFLLILLMIPFIPFANAALEIEKKDKGSVVISELDNPAVFQFTINNRGQEETIELFSYVGISFSPRGAFEISRGENVFEVKAYPNSEIRQRKDIYEFEYFIRGQYSGITKDSLSVTIVPLKETLEISGENIIPGDKEAVINVRNTKNTNLENLRIRLVSDFFDSEKNFSLEPYSSVKVPVNLNQERLKTMLAGNYIFTTEVNLNGAKTSIESTVNYAEKGNSTIYSEEKGYLVRNARLTRTNTGNILIIGKIETSRDALSRLFTVHSLEPQEVDRKGLYITYRWEKNLAPGESFTVETKTNYTLPFILILLVIIIAVLTKIYTNRVLVIEKRVSFVKTRGGEFALKIKLYVKAKKYVENIQIIDRLPGMTQLYEKFGVKPDRIDSASRRLFWNIDRLNAGEERVFSYIIYSKVKVVGRFELPSATAVFQREGKTENAESNRTFFAAETGRSDSD